MSTDDKRKRLTDDDGLADLMNAFGGYTEGDESDRVDINIDVQDDYTLEEISIELPELPEEDTVIPHTAEPAAEESAAAVTEQQPDEEEIVERTRLKKKKKVKTEPKEENAASEIPEGKTITAASTESVDTAEPDPVVHEVKHQKPKKEKTPKKDKADKPEEKTEKEKPKKQTEADSADSDNNKSASPVRLVVVLTAICAAVALLLATVNNFTETKIAENNELAMLQSIREIFDETVQAEAITVPEGSALTSAYLVLKDGGVCGYSAAVAPSGFGGPINLMVGVDSEGTVVGVEVISMSETPGLGSKTGRDDFLSLFKGKNGEITVDAISGATISSKAVMTGVNSVTNNLLDIASLAAERGMSVVPFAADDAVGTETETPVTEPVQTTAITAAPETTDATETEDLPAAPDVSKGDTPPEIIVENPNNENPGIMAEYEQGTTEFETLTTEPETSELEDTDGTGEETPEESSAKSAEE